MIADGSKARAGGYGLKCAKCGATLTGVARTTTSDGFINRERTCDGCGFINVTDERVIHAREVRSYNRKLLE